MQKKKPTRKDKFSSDPIPTSRAPKTTASYSSLIPGLIIAVLGFILYSNTLGHHFTLDDYSVILENRLTKQGISAIPEIFKTSYRYGYYFTDDNLYRPLVKSMFAIEWWMAPNSATPGHWINVLLYAFTGFILFQSLLRISKGNMMFSFIASLLFIAHPVHTEVVASIKSRDEILAFLFSIWALERFISHIRSGNTGSLIASALLFFVALLSKESAITFLAVFPLTAWFFTDQKPSSFLKSSIPLLVSALCFLVLRGTILSGIIPESVSIADNLLEAAKDPVTRYATAIYILGLYLKILLLPHPLVFDYSFNQIPLTGIASVGFLISFTVYAALFVFAIMQFKSKNMLSFAILFYLITLSISSNLFITIGSSMGERFLYAPSLGFCIGIAVLITKLVKEKEQLTSMNWIKIMPVAIILFVVVGAYSVKTIARNPVWENNYTLYTNDVLLSPNSTRTHYYLGNYLVKPEAWEGKSESEKNDIIYRGISELKKSVEIYPGFSDAFTQMGVAYYKLNKMDSAMVNYQKALKLNPGYATIHNNIGTVYFAQQQFDQALSAFKKATELDPRYAEAYANLGSAYGMMQQYDNALSSLFNAVKWDPNYAQAYYFIGLTYRFKGDEANAVAYLEKAYKLDPSLRPK